MVRVDGAELQHQIQIPEDLLFSLVVYPRTVCHHLQNRKTRSVWFETIHLACDRKCFQAVISSLCPALGLNPRIDRANLEQVMWESYNCAFVHTFTADNAPPATV